MKNLFLVLFGAAILAGNQRSKDFFLEALKYFIYVATEFCIFLINSLPRFVEEEIYEDLLNIYFNMPYNVVRYFRFNTEPFLVSGYIMVGLGFTGLLKEILSKR
jgi:hypothetical protein